VGSDAWLYPLPPSEEPFEIWPAQLLLCAMALGESEGEGRMGMKLVCQVAINRAHDDRRRWGRDLRKVILQPKQFSAFDDGRRVAVMRYPQKYVTAEVYADAFRASCEALWGEDSLAGGANHYLTLALAACDPPRWYDADKITMRHGRHVFLRL
jgi:spore germination cell wall hydrolase CwlJ-like protein